MLEYIGFFSGGLLVGLVASRVWHKYLEEDASLIKQEVQALCDRLDKVITEFRQAAASLKVGKS
jgi:hypothetical protein